ncbi:hypothetical protein L195_g026111 [Trifolium pratense]|uniref:Uncharacterized protein n=1 Tax=Trifolium pratense TaxID=57577 RepID=A0A2K3NID9_TRIPR|nr:hypothetical protein L195_g026015 [Trifolium pratense]PNY02791.1 hypothetical protein L195_g026111 [Trifolium pratense]
MLKLMIEIEIDENGEVIDAELDREDRGSILRNCDWEGAERNYLMPELTPN